MPSETLDYLEPQDEALVVDATLGLGGHTEMILTAAKNSRVIAIDQDREAIDLASKRLDQFRDRLDIVHANFTEIAEILRDREIDKVDCIIADLGVSSMQMDSEVRGFSFRYDAPLDMRMNRESDSETAAELLERLSEEEIANIIYQYGEERFSRRIARRIVEKRKEGAPIRTTVDLAQLVTRSVKRNEEWQP